MSRRKQTKPRHVDSEEPGITNSQENVPVTDIPDELTSELSTALTDDLVANDLQQEEPVEDTAETDAHLCGLCQEEFFGLDEFIAHKKVCQAADIVGESMDYYDDEESQIDSQNGEEDAGLHDVPMSGKDDEVDDIESQDDLEKMEEGSVEALENERLTPDKSDGESDTKSENVSEGKGESSNLSSDEGLSSQDGIDGDETSEKLSASIASGVDLPQIPPLLSLFQDSNVKLARLESTKVAVAQFAENNMSNLPQMDLASLQTMLVSLQQQQLMQLQLLQQLQHQLLSSGNNAAVQQSIAVAMAAAAAAATTAAPLPGAVAPATIAALMPDQQKSSAKTNNDNNNSMNNNNIINNLNKLNNNNNNTSSENDIKVEKRFKCLTCGNRYLTIEILREHQVSHNHFSKPFDISSMPDICGGLEKSVALPPPLVPDSQASDSGAADGNNGNNNNNDRKQTGEGEGSSTLKIVTTNSVPAVTSLKEEEEVLAGDRLSKSLLEKVGEPSAEMTHVVNSTHTSPTVSISAPPQMPKMPPLAYLPGLMPFGFPPPFPPHLPPPPPPPPPMPPVHHAQLSKHVEDPMEQYMEVAKSETTKLQQLVENIEAKLTDPNQCVICQKILSCKSALQMHYRTHTGERPFKCKICKRGFTTKGNLKVHLGVHRTKPSMQMSYQCSVCHKQFTNGLVLQQHVRTHTAQMPKEAPGLHEMMSPYLPYHAMPFMPLMFYPHLSPPSVQLGASGELDLRKTSTGEPPEKRIKQEEPQSLSRHYSEERMQCKQENSAADESADGPYSESDDKNEMDDQPASPENGLSHIESKQDGDLSMPYSAVAEGQSSRLHDNFESEGRRDSRSPSPDQSHSPAPNVDNPASPGSTHSRDVPSSSPHPVVPASFSASFLAMENHPKSIDSPSQFSGMHPLENLANILRRSELNLPVGQQYIGSLNQRLYHDADPRDLGSKDEAGPAVSPLNSRGLPSPGAQSDRYRKMGLPHPSATPSPLNPLFNPGPTNMHLPFSPSQSNTTCNICWKTFSSKSSLNIHYRSHTQERPFKCEVCERSFTTKGNMKQHMLTHNVRDDTSRSSAPSHVTDPTGSSPERESNVISPFVSPVSASSSVSSIRSSPSPVSKRPASEPNQESHLSGSRMSTPSRSQSPSHHTSPSHPLGAVSSLGKFTDSYAPLREMSSIARSQPQAESPRVGAGSHEGARIGGPQTPVASHHPVNSTSTPPVKRANKHVCTVCDKPFSSSSGLQIHFRTHTGDKPFKCTICGKAFTTKGNLKVHMGTHMWNTTPSRRGRRMGIDNTASLFANQARQGFLQAEKPFKCLTCGNRYSSKQHLRDHQVRHNHFSKYPDMPGMPIMHDGMDRPGAVPPPLIPAHQMVKISTPKEGDRPKSSKVLEGATSPTSASVPSNSSPNVPVRDASDKHSPANMSSNYLAQMTSLVSSTHTSPSVSISTPTQSMMHGMGSAPNLPGMPPFGFEPPFLPVPPVPRPSILPKNAEDPLEQYMEITKSETSKLQQLVENIETKLTDPNQCAICHRILSCKSALQMHYRTHTGERPFKCKICGRAFTTKGNLKTHMGVHRSKPPMRMLHQCPVCHKQFTNALVLQQHIRMHTGEIPKDIPIPNGIMSPYLPFPGFPFMPGMYHSHMTPPPNAQLGASGELDLRKTPASEPAGNAAKRVKREEESDSRSEHQDDEFMRHEEDQQSLDGISKHQDSELDDRTESEKYYEDRDPHASENESRDEPGQYSPRAVSPSEDDLSRQKDESPSTPNRDEQPSSPHDDATPPHFVIKPVSPTPTKSTPMDFSSLYPSPTVISSNYVPTTYSASLMALEDRVKSIGSPSPLSVYSGLQPLEHLTNILRRSDLNMPNGHPLGMKMDGSAEHSDRKDGSAASPAASSSGPSPGAHSNVDGNESSDGFYSPGGLGLMPPLYGPGSIDMNPLPFNPNKPHTTCNICWKTFACKSALDIHYRSHTKERPFKCECCERSFSTRGNMKQHMLTHKIRDMPNQSSVSESGSPSSGHSPASSGNVTPTSSNPISTSPAAPTSWTSPSTPASGEKPSSEEGQKTTPTSAAAAPGASPTGNLPTTPSHAAPASGAPGTPVTPKAHSERHSSHPEMPSMPRPEIRPELQTPVRRTDNNDTSSPFVKRPNLKHVCQMCNKPFSSASALQIHFRTHTGDKPFKCTICGKAFTTKGNLKVHMGTHMWNNTPSRRGRRMSIDNLPPAFPTPDKSDFFPGFPHRSPAELYPFPPPFPGFHNGFPPKMNEISVIQSINGGMGPIPPTSLPASLTEAGKAHAPGTPSSGALTPASGAQSVKVPPSVPSPHKPDFMHGLKPDHLRPEFLKHEQMMREFMRPGFMKPEHMKDFPRPDAMRDFIKPDHMKDFMKPNFMRPEFLKHEEHKSERESNNNNDKDEPMNGTSGELDLSIHKSSPQPSPPVRMASPPPPSSSASSPDSEAREAAWAWKTTCHICNQACASTAALEAHMKVHLQRPQQSSPTPLMT